MVVLYLILILLAAFLGVLLVRTAAFKPEKKAAPAVEPVAFDRDAAVSSLQTLIRFKTISNADPALEDDAEFEKLIASLPELFPQVARVCTFTRLPDRGLLYKWEGEAHDEPSVMMAHYDVVPIEGISGPNRRLTP